MESYHLDETFFSCLVSSFLNVYALCFIGENILLSACLGYQIASLTCIVINSLMAISVGCMYKMVFVTFVFIFVLI